MFNMPGFGDSATWPAYISPRDPRWNGPPDDEEEDQEIEEDDFDDQNCPCEILS